MALVERILTYGRMIRFSHSIFALPFALSGAALAAVRTGIATRQVFWIVVAMVGARSAAMGFNRLVDRKIDAANPRTAGRELPRGAISAGAVRVFILLSSAVLILAAYQLNTLCFALSPVALGIVFFYSYTKRFTWATQIFLGLSLAVAPIGAWIAVTGRLHPEILLLGGAVLAWVAGFDAIYACQDVAFDSGYGLYSLPQRLGVRNGLRIARLLHMIAFGLLLSVGAAFGLGRVYMAGVVIVGALLLYEHRLVRHDDMSRVDVAFFNMNGIISSAYFLFTFGDIML